jgi:septal ring factor EnvC (AmiA/AmiB activator)
VNPQALTTYVGWASMAVVGGFSLVRWRSSEKRQAAKDVAREQESAVKNDANLRDDQRELLAMLYERDKASQDRIDKLQGEVDRLRLLVEHLQSQLAAEQRMREASDARAVAESSARQRLRISSTADEREITEMGDTAEQKYRDKNPEPDA